MAVEYPLSVKRREPERATQDISFARSITHFRRQRGLSREQLARASRLSRTYIYHLELGRRTHPSQHVVKRIASALELPAVDRQWLYDAYERLTGQEINEICAEQMVPALEEVIEAFVHGTSFPTHALDRLWYITSWNEAALDLFELLPADVMGGEPLHLLESLFTPSFRQRVPQWEQVAYRLVDDFISSTQAFTHLPEYKALCKRLQMMPGFAAIAKVSALGQGPFPSFQIQLRHSRWRLLTLRTVTTRVVGSYGAWMISYIPDDQRTLELYR